MSQFLEAPRPRWFTIGAHRPFLADLAAGLWRTLVPLGESALARATVLAPTRRACRALASAFLQAAEADGRSAALLPQIRALGDLEAGEPPLEAGAAALDLPPAIEPLRRRFELASLVAAHAHLLEREALDTDQALDLARALAELIDSRHIAALAGPFDFESLVTSDLARHWELSARFLALAFEAWPARLAELGLMDVAERRVALTRALALALRESPPSEVLVAAGSTGADPATAELLAAVAQAPAGAVVLPGLDKALAESAWSEVGEAHPQGAMKRLLETAGVARSHVGFWDPASESYPAGRWRRRLINEALRPPLATADWLGQIAALREESPAGGVDPIAEGLTGLTSLTAANEEDAASIAALLLREALETPGKTAALVTPDATLARRVSARLRRWGISADSSSGQPLSSLPIGALIARTAQAARTPADSVALLAVVKHPLVRLRLDSASLGRARHNLELRALRGARPGSWAAIAARLAAWAEEGEAKRETAEGGEAWRAQAAAEAMDLADRLRAALETAAAPFAAGAARASEAARALATALESLAAGPRGGVGELWSGQAGECAAALFSRLLAEGESLPPLTPAGFGRLLEVLMAEQAVRSAEPAESRLLILGVLEARLVRADRLILAGLEEGVWPRPAPVDPFLSRPMRERLGLPAPERRIGLSAHDFAQAASAPEVFLLDMERRGGAPAVASRWLWRLRTLAKGAGIELPGRADLVAWARGLDAPSPDPRASLRTARRPAPRPPLAARPRQMSVTAVERWIRDPYAIYARDILRLRPLAAPDEPVEAMARGSAMHAALEAFVRAHPQSLPPDAEKVVAGLILEALAEAGMSEPRMAREAGLAPNLAAWLLRFEESRRPGAELFVETRGVLVFDTPGGPFTLTARADRIERRGAWADILDFKTGGPPTRAQVVSGLAPQLTLTGAILAGDGFAEIGSAGPGELVYVRVSGGRKPGDVVIIAAPPESETLCEAAARNLLRRVAHFDEIGTPYPSWPRPQYRSRYGGDYDHLARLWEWNVVAEETP